MCKWDTTGDKDRDVAARERAVEFNRWIRGALLKAGARRTILPVTNAEEDYGNTGHGILFQDVNKKRIIETQQALDPDGIFAANRVVS